MRNLLLALILAAAAMGTANAEPSRFDGPSNARNLAAQYNTSNGE